MTTVFQNKVTAKIGYVAKKIAHMRRMGLVAASSSGLGKHGGAAPDWLAADQREAEKRA